MTINPADPTTLVCSPGLNSSGAIQLTALLESKLGARLPATLVGTDNYKCIHMLCVATHTSTTVSPSQVVQSVVLTSTFFPGLSGV